MDVMSVAQNGGTTPTAFIIMPFASKFDNVYEAIKQVVKTVDIGLGVTRLDEIRAAGRISDDLVQELASCALCIADVTGSNANVMWEVGYATALRKPVIALSEQGSPLPFDLKDVNFDVRQRLVG